MTEELLTKQLDNLKAALEGHLDGKIKAEITAAINKMQKQIDDLLAEGKLPQSGGQRIKTRATELHDQLQKFQPALAKYKQGEGKGFQLELKDVGDMSSATSLTGSYFVPPTVVPGVTAQPYEEIHMRDMLPTGTTTSNMIRYIRDNGGEGGPTVVAEGASKPQMDRDLQIYDANVRKIATFMRVPEEMIEDISYLTSFLSQIGVAEVMAVEDDQILYGDGTGQNLSGLFTNATLFNPADSVVADANEFDVLRAARKQLRNAKIGGPLRAVISPDDYFNMTSQKDTTNNYLFLGGGNGIALASATGSPSALNVNGIIVEEHTAVNSGDFLVFQPRSAAIFDRTGTMVRLYDQDADNVTKNLITIVIEKRLALPIYRPAGLIKGTFTAAISDLANDSE